jgi:hypothetical protein
MSDNKFSVVFDAENLLSAQIRVIATQLDELRATADNAARPVNRIVNSLSKLTTLDYDTAKTGLSAINRQLAKMSEINPDNLERVFGVFRNLKLNTIASQMERIANASSGVAKAVASVPSASVSQPIVTSYPIRPAMSGVVGNYGRPQKFFSLNRMGEFDTDGGSTVGIGGIDNKLSSEAKSIASEIDQLSNKLASISKPIISTANALKKLTTLNYEKSVDGLQELHSELFKISKIDATKIERISNALRKLNVTRSTSARNQQNILGATSSNSLQGTLQQIRNVQVAGALNNPFINYQQRPSGLLIPSTNIAGYQQSASGLMLPAGGFGGFGGGGGGFGGGGGGGGGFGGDGGGNSFFTSKMKMPVALSNLMNIVSVYNSLTFAIGTLSMAFDNLTQYITEANNVTKQLATIQAVAAQEGVYKLDSATERYSHTVREAIRNQMMFGGSLNDNLNSMLKFQQISMAEGVDVRQLNQISQLLSLRDPVQGIEGATIALQELFSGDPVSLRRRFELPASDINKIANESGNASKQIRMLTQVLAEQGITLDVLNARLNTTAQTYDQLASNAKNLSIITGQQMASALEGQADTLNKVIATIVSGGIRDLDVSAENPFTALLMGMSNLHARFFAQLTGGQTDLQREIAATNVEQGVLLSEGIRLSTEYGRAYSDLVRAYADGRTELEKQLALTRAIQSAQGQEQMVLSVSDEDLQQQMKSIEQNRIQTATTMLLTAAVQAYSEGNRNAASTLAQVMQIQGDESISATEKAQALIDAQIALNGVTQESANAIFGLSSKITELSNKYRDLITSQIESLQQSQMQVEVEEHMISLAQSLIDGNFNLSNVISKLAVRFGITNGTAIEYLTTLYELDKFVPKIIQNMGVVNDYINMHQDVFRISEENIKKAVQNFLDKFKDTEKAVKERNDVVRNNNDQLLKIEKDTLDKLIAYDEEAYRKRIRALQAFYSETVLVQQKRQYEMTANNLDLVEGRNNKLDLKEKQRLLARENIEAYASLQLNEAIKKANEFAINSSASFAKEYLSIQQERIGETESLNYKLHDTMVRLEGDTSAQERAKQIHAQAISELETYYSTRVGLAEAAARDESEAERSQRSTIIDDAIKGVMELQNVDEKQRQTVIEGLQFTKTAITDLSKTYVDKIDAMRGSLELLAKAMRDIGNATNILTPEQMNAFNNMPSGIGRVNGQDVNVTNTNTENTFTEVNVGGISVNVTTQADPNEIARAVLGILNSQIGTRSS